MKRVLWTSLLMLAALPALALGPSVGFGVHGNMANINLNNSSFKDVYGPGYGGGAHLNVNFMMLSLRFSGDYIRFSPDNSKFQSDLANQIGSAAAGYTIDGGAISIMSGNANLKWDILPIPVLSPYLTGGVGMANLKTDDLSVMSNGVPVKQLSGGGSSEFRTSANVGAGVDLNLGITLFLEVKYTWIFTDGGTSTYAPVTLGITF